jgi:hypothetical protein
MKLTLSILHNQSGAWEKAWSIVIRTFAHQSPSCGLRKNGCDLQKVVRVMQIIFGNQRALHGGSGSEVPGAGEKQISPIEEALRNGRWRIFRSLAASVGKTTALHISFSKGSLPRRFALYRANSQQD